MTYLSKDKFTLYLAAAVWMFCLDVFLPEMAFVEASIVFGILALFEKTTQVKHPVDTETSLTEEQKGKLETELANAISKGNKVKAIKAYRQIHGCNLKEAKDYIDTQITS